MMLAPVLLFAALVSPASAQKLPDCIHVSTTAVKASYKPDLDSVRDCQEKVRRQMVESARTKGKPLSDHRLEQIDDLQRAEVSEFLANSGTVIDGASKSARSIGGVTAADRAKVSAEDGAANEGLEQRLHSAAGDGKDGITPAMGRDIIETLTQQQGGVSPDMKELLDSVVRDGGKLTPETMKKLQGAGRAAKAAGLDLNIDKNTEKDLLEHDFDKDKDVPPAPPAAPGYL